MRKGYNTCTCVSNCFVRLSVRLHKNNLPWSFMQLHEFYLVLIYQTQQKNYLPCQLAKN